MVASSMPAFPGGELRLLPNLVDYLVKSGRIREGTVVAHELSWRGRRVDLATLTASGSLSAYELKIGNVGRVLEQAIYNAHSFDRSWVVVDRIPSARQITLAYEHGIGVLVVGTHACVIAHPVASKVHPIIRGRLTRQVELARHG